LLLNNIDPGNQLEWLEGVLQDAQSNGEKVYLIGHIPWGVSSCVSTYSTQVHSIIDKYHDIIAGQFYGHTHNDQFEVFRDVATDTIPISVAFIVPSITTYGGLNPSFRVFQYNRTSFELLDYTEYVVNLTEANLNDRADWFISYSAREAYSLNSLQPADMQDFIVRMGEDDDLFDEYLLNYYSLVNSTCNAQCKHTMLCETSSCTYALFKICTKGTNYTESPSLCSGN